MSIRPSSTLLAVCLAGLVLTGCGGAGDESPPSPSAAPSMPTAAMSDEDAAAIDAAVQTVLDTAGDNVPALYLGIWDPDRGQYVTAYGEAADGTPATVDDSTRIGSISKTFTATVVLQLVDEGTLSLDQTVSEVAPAVSERFPDTAPLTIEQLLAMESGLPDYLNSPEGAVAAIVDDPEHVWTADELIDVGIGLGVDEPGTQGYSTTNYLLLQEIAEEVTGKSLQDLVAERITQPVGLERTTLPQNDDTDLPEPAAHSAITPSCRSEFAEAGATVKVGTDVTDWSASYGQGGGGMTSTIGDLGAWAATMSGNELLDEATADQRMQLANVDGIQYGLGILQVGDWVGHEGEALGWEAWAVHDPGTGVTLAMASNSCGVFDQFLTLTEALYPDVSMS